MLKKNLRQNLIVFGFDSAWTDHPDKPGAICAIELDKNGESIFHTPVLASFSDASNYVEKRQITNGLNIVAIDQSLIVKNPKGMRPVEKVAGAIIGRAGGGVQPSNTSRIGMFDDKAPIHNFLKSLNASNNPILAKQSSQGRYIIEVFPALALLGLNEEFYKVRKAPKYNPDNKRKFKLEDWQTVVCTVTKKSQELAISGLTSWLKDISANNNPKKPDQDRLDATICSLVGIIWISCPESHSIMIGNMESGYMITPVNQTIKEGLDEASKRHGLTQN